MLLLMVSECQQAATVVRMHGELDHDSLTPLFEQIAANLRQAISDGEITGRLPSEEDLCELYDVSRPTAHRAVQILVDEGIAERSPGRGTYLARTPGP